MSITGVSKRINKLEQAQKTHSSRITIACTLFNKWAVICKEEPLFDTLAEAVEYVRDDLGLINMDIYDLHYNAAKLSTDELNLCIKELQSDKKLSKDITNKFLLESDQLQQARKDYPRLKLNHVLSIDPDNKYFKHVGV
ncbi:MAG TPA: hypothetical protein DG851_04075 [Lactobacillus acetotolerans]|jgi:hypothetical protein|uniref:hypothetical protein n=1 Tax=Lactobacillus acetotolerans TaxID=1600 RepID=UPI000EDF9B0A|nr:hypothetical protein [Lactobacillus acetotolerans]HCX40174.1 hypothetical protein [Lactobacillus acetotolerans]